MGVLVRLQTAKIQTFVTIFEWNVSSHTNCCKSRSRPIFVKNGTWQIGFLNLFFTMVTSLEQLLGKSPGSWLTKRNLPMVRIVESSAVTG